MSTLHVILSKRLKSFSEASTSSESKGFVNAGTYSLKELKKDYPNADTDYALIESTDLGDVWICSRWKDNSYIETHASPEPQGDQTTDFIDAAGVVSSAKDTIEAISKISFNSNADAIEESNLVSIVKDFNGFSYDLHKPTYPFELKGINVPQGPPNQNNCCTFVEAITVKAWMDSFPDFEWNNKRHGQMMIFSTEDYFSPVTAAIESGMGEKVEDVEEAPNPWTLVQGWKAQWTGGHTFLIVDHHKETDKILTLDRIKLLV